MTEVALVGLVVAVIILTIIARRRRAAWPGNLRRLHAGVSRRAEWMAPDEIVRGVEADYLAGQRWMAETLLLGYSKFVKEASQYFAGAYLKWQQKAVNMQLQAAHCRYIGVLQAEHELSVRHFSDDGLSCFLLDCQTERKMVTYEYWQLRAVNSQNLARGTYVYRMVYDRAARRWKVEDLVQQLPLGWDCHTANIAIRLEESLPSVLGRDI
jgi:hypothetical protein